MEDYIIIGKTKKAFGLEGEVRFQIEDRYVEDFDAADVVYLKIMGKPLPYFIESVRVMKMPLVKFEDVNSPEEASLITSCEMMMKSSDLKSYQLEEEEEEMQYGWLKGFVVKEKEIGEIGKIVDVLDYPQQELAMVIYEGKEVLIPLNEQFITKIEEKNSTIYMELPEGLLDS